MDVKMNYDNSPIIIFMLLFLLFVLFLNPWALSTIKIRFYQMVYNSPLWIRKFFFREDNKE